MGLHSLVEEYCSVHVDTKSSNLAEAPKFSALPIS